MSVRPNAFDDAVRLVEWGQYGARGQAPRVQSNELAAFLQSKREEVDAMYADFEECIARQFAEMNSPPVQLTRRQRLLGLVWRVQNAVAAPFAWVVRLLVPHLLASEAE